MSDSQTQQGYEALRAQELSGSGIASPTGPSWGAQQAYSRAQEQATAAEAKAISAKEQARNNWLQNQVKVVKQKVR